MKLLKDLLGITRRQRLRRLELQVNQNVKLIADVVMFAGRQTKSTADLMLEGQRIEQNTNLATAREIITIHKLIQEVARERGMKPATFNELKEKSSIHASQRMLILGNQSEDFEAFLKQREDDAKKSQDEEES
jgi:urease gamma subunit